MEILLPLMGLAGGVGFIFLVFLAKQFVYVGRPNEVLIFSGKQQTLPDGSIIGYRHTHGGWTFRVPILETVERMDLRLIPIELQVNNAYSQGGIPLAVHAIAFVKVSSNPRQLPNAIERFLGRDPNEIKQVAKETLEGHLRGVLASMTPEEVNEDRLKFAEELVTEASEDFSRLGLVLDTLKVQSVSDDVSYLDSIGRESLAKVLSTAEIAESTAKSEAEAVQAQQTELGQVANEQAETAIALRNNELRRVKAELEAAAKSEEERAEQGALAAKARAEVALQEIRAKLEHQRLAADVVLPAESAKQAAEMAARAEAATIVADGQAMANVLQMMTDTWLTAGADAKDIFLIQQLETIMTTVTDRVKNLEIGEVTILDGGDGRALPNYLAALPATVTAVLKEFRETTGVDITGILNSSEVK